MVRDNGSARAETNVKAAARPKTIRITMRGGPLRDTLDDDLSTITISAFFAWLGMRSGMERTESTYSVFAAVHMIPPGSQLDPFYLLARKAPTHDERGCKRSA
jgi:hypothetical protein